MRLADRFAFDSVRREAQDPSCDCISWPADVRFRPGRGVRSSDAERPTFPSHHGLDSLEIEIGDSKGRRGGLGTQTDRWSASAAGRQGTTGTASNVATTPQCGFSARSRVAPYWLLPSLQRPQLL